MESLEPGYLELYKSGEMERRVRALEARLETCDICPRACGVNRLAGETSYCHAGSRAIVSSFCTHHGEEPALSGSRGSGTIFFGYCNMRCVYCQNFQISQDYRQGSKEVAADVLAGHMLYLQNELDCHNINLVSPSHFVPQIARAVLTAVPQGLRLPLVYNTSSYDSVASLRELDGIVNIYLADLRYASNRRAGEFSGAADYADRAREAVSEMYRQVGELEVDDQGIARQGLIVRLLVLPEGIGGCAESLRWLAGELSPDVTVSVMSQYYPAHRAHLYPALSRKITPAEYDEVTTVLEELGMENGWVQGMNAPESYRPDFSGELPFPAAGEK